MPLLLTPFQSSIDFNNETFSDLLVTFGPSLSKLDRSNMPYDGADTSSKRRWLRKLSPRLALEFNTLPSGMTVRVVDVSQEGMHLGGYADIYTARYDGKVVVLKRFKVHQREITSQKIRVQCHFMALMVKGH